MNKVRKRLLTFLIAVPLFAIISVPARALEVNKSNLWYGGNKGIEVIWKTGKNLAYTEKNKKIDPRMTQHARAFDQALLKKRVTM